MATPRLMGPLNFIPKATNQAIALIRQPGQFALMQYVQLVRAPAPVVVYAFLDPDQPIRMVSSAEFDWPYGQNRPKPTGNLANFKYVEVRVERKWYGYNLARETVENADGFNPEAFHNAIMISIAMTELTQRFVTLYENPSNWGANTADANTLNGGAGTWDAASNDPNSASFLAIKKSLQKAARNVVLSSNGMIRWKDLIVVLTPDSAEAISQTAEYHTYLEKSMFAQKQLAGDEPNLNGEWGIGTRLYGLHVVVEDAAIVNTRPDSAGDVAVVDTNKIFIRDKTKALLCSRPGGLDGNYGSPSFSTLQRYVNKYEMSVEVRQQEWDRNYESGVVDESKEVLAVPQGGYLITNCLS